MALSIEHVAIVKCGGYTWKPNLFEVNGTTCVLIAPYDFGSVSIVAAMAGIDIRGTAARKPSLNALDGYTDLKNRRNATQAALLDGSATQATRSLFGDDPADAGGARKRARRMPRDTAATLRENPTFIDIPIGDEGDVISVQRPVLARDLLVVQFSEIALRNILVHIKDQGVTSFKLFERNRATSSRVDEVDGDNVGDASEGDEES